MIESHNSNKRTVVEGVGTVRMFSVYSDVTLHVPVYTWRTAWSPGRSRCWRGAPRTRPPPPPPRPPRRCAARTWRSWSWSGWASLPHWCHCPRSPGPGRGSRSRWRSSRSTRTLHPEPGRGGNINNAQLSFISTQLTCRFFLFFVWNISAMGTLEQGNWTFDWQYFKALKLTEHKYHRRFSRLR